MFRTLFLLLFILKFQWFPPTLIDPPELSPDYELPSQSFLTSPSLILSEPSPCTSKSPITMIVSQKQNRPILVRVLTHTGPEYWAKSLTARCFRHSSYIYYTSRFADLFLSMLLTNEARVSTSVDTLYVHFGSTSETLPLLPKNRQFWNDLTRDITSHIVFKEKVLSLKRKAAAAGELDVITHDETFKTLFAVLGQKKMS